MMGEDDMSDEERIALALARHALQRVRMRCDGCGRREYVREPEYPMYWNARRGRKQWRVLRLCGGCRVKPRVPAPVAWWA